MSRPTLAFTEGIRLARASVIVLIAVGVGEILSGLLTKSVTLTADGVDAICDSVISLIVWAGLHFSRRRPDQKFNFGYFKVESFSALVASIGMVAVAGYVLYHSYIRFLNPSRLSYAPVAVLALLTAGLVSTYLAVKVRRLASKHGLLALKANANNSIKDTLGTFVGLGSVLGATLGVTQLDSVGGMIVGIFILSVAYFTMKESSLVLLDAFESSDIATVLTDALQTVDGVRSIDRIMLRQSGPYFMGVISVTVDQGMTIGQSESVRRRLEDIISTIIEPQPNVAIVFRSSRIESQPRSGK